MKFKNLPRAIRMLIYVVIAIEVVLPLVMALCRNKLLFFPAASPSPQAALASFGTVPVLLIRVRRPDGRQLAAYDVTPLEADADGPVVLFFHGNAGNIASRAGLAAWFAKETRCRVLMPDYSGYGGNEGSPSEDEIGTDALAAYDQLVSIGVPPSRIVVFGESIGGGPALVVASQRKVAGVALQSTFSSLSSMAWRSYPWVPLAALFVRGAFPNAERIAALEVPVLVVHGKRDSIIPFAEGEALRDAARPGTEFLPIDGADHNDLFDIAGAKYVRGLGERFRRWTHR